MQNTVLAALQAVSTSIDWGAVNTALTLGAIAYLYRQARVVDSVRQLLLGPEGTTGKGLVDEVTLVRERTHELANTMQALDGSVKMLSRQLEENEAQRLRIERRNEERGTA